MNLNPFWDALRTKKLKTERTDAEIGATRKASIQAAFRSLSLEDLLKPRCGVCGATEDMLNLDDHHACKRCLISLIHKARQLPFCLLCDTQRRGS